MVQAETGALLSDFSDLNLRGLSRRSFPLLLRSLGEYLERDKRRGWWTQPLTVAPEDSLERALLLFVATGVRTLYVLDQAQRPVGALNHRDLLQQVARLLTAPPQTAAP